MDVVNNTVPFVVGLVFGLAGGWAITNSLAISKAKKSLDTLKNLGSNLVTAALAAYGVDVTINVPAGTDDNGDPVPAHTEVVRQFTDANFNTALNTYQTESSQVLPM